VLGKIFKGLSLAGFSALSIGNVQKGQARNMALGKGCRYARIHSTGHKANRQIWLTIIRFG